VSSSVYNRITGIWKEKERLTRRIRVERQKQLEKFRRDKARLKVQESSFKRKKKEILKQAIKRKTLQIERALRRSEQREAKVEARARNRIERIEASSMERAEKLAKAQLSKYKSSIRESVRLKIKVEKGRAVARERIKNVKLQRSVRSTLIQMKSQTSEIESQRKQIAELQRQLDKQSTPQIEGLLYEKNLVRELKHRFPKDEIIHKGKGGDILQNVRDSEGRDIGVIVYECKRVKHFNSKYITQTFLAKELRKADFAILVTNAMRKNTNGFFTEKEVMIVHATGVMSLSSVLRKQIIQISSMKLGQLERDRAVRMTLDYIEGPEFINALEGIIGETMKLHHELVEEAKKHFSTWQTRYASYQRIHGKAFEIKVISKSLLQGNLPNSEAIPSFPDMEFPEIPREREKQIPIIV